jgi:hypothetical protein
MTTEPVLVVESGTFARSPRVELVDSARALRWLGLAAAVTVAAATALVTYRLSPLVLLYWDVGRLLPSSTFSLQIAAAVVNVALLAGVLALAALISRVPVMRRQRSALAGGASVILAVSIVVLLVYLYPLARARVLVGDLDDAGETTAAVTSSIPA